MKNLTLAAGGEVSLSAPARPPRPARLQTMAQVFDAASGAIEAVYLVELFVKGQTPRPVRVLACLFNAGVEPRQAEATIARLSSALGSALQVASEMDLLPVLPGDQLAEPVKQVGCLIYPPAGGTPAPPAAEAAAPPGDEAATAAKKPWWKLW